MEFVRHRVFSFAQESTRYCNYSKDKFGNEITFIIPCWFDNIDNDLSINKGDKLFLNIKITRENEEYHKAQYKAQYFAALLAAEEAYFNLINHGWIAQQARSVLPNSLKTELIMTGFVSDWKHFFSLRDAGSAHPQARELAQPLHEEFITKNYI